MTDLFFHDVEVDGEHTEVRVSAGTISAAGPDLRCRSDDEVIDGHGGALLPGLWDHHVHLLAGAAAMRSAHVGPAQVKGLDDLRVLLERAPVTPSGWVRAVGYHESGAGPLDRSVLDGLGLDRPIRVQHRSGSLWTLDSLAMELLGLDVRQDPAIERTADRRATGRVFGGDDLLRSLLPDDPPDLAGLGGTLTASGVVGVLDATPTVDASSWEVIARACRSGAIPQRVWVTGAPPLADVIPPEPLRQGPVKIYLADHDLPTFDVVSAAVASARSADRAVAFHSVTRASLILALAVLDDTPPHPGDRIEHGAVIPAELVAELATRRLTVVTQPGFVSERGDRYLDEVAPDDLPHLYRCRSLLDAGVAVAGSTDLPFTRPDPWAAIGAAMRRRTSEGLPLGTGEAIDPATALKLFLGPPEAPGGPPRRVAAGSPADLCLLDRPLHEQLADPTRDAVVATIIGGVAHGAR